MTIFSIFDSHLVFIGLAALLLLFSQIFKLSVPRHLSVGILIFEILRIVFLYSDALLHLSLDLIVISGLVIFCLSFKAKTAQLAAATIGLGAFVLGHGIMPELYPRITGLKTELQQQRLEGMEAITNTFRQPEASPPIDLLVRFKTKSELRNWISHNKTNKLITYPLFQPADESFMLDEYVGLRLPVGSDFERTKAELFSHPHILDVELNDEVTLEQLPYFEQKDLRTADPIITNKTILNDPMLGRQELNRDRELEAFHKLLRTKTKALKNSKPIVIAILDTGVDKNHEDLKANYRSTSRRYDSDIKGHGTHCAGVAAAVTGNKIGIASLLPIDSPVKVTGVKVLNNLGLGSQKKIIDGIIEAVDKGCDVISLSLGGVATESRELAYTEAVRYATSKGVIVLAAAGNSGGDAQQHSPANTPGLIAVTAVDAEKKKAAFANSVSELEMGLAAPGVMILSTMPDDNYEAHTGTSMATPLVAGMIGLMKFYEPELDAKQAFKILEKTAYKSDGLAVINPVAAMTELLK